MQLHCIALQHVGLSRHGNSVDPTIYKLREIFKVLPILSHNWGSDFVVTVALKLLPRKNGEVTKHKYGCTEGATLMRCCSSDADARAMGPGQSLGKWSVAQSMLCWTAAAVINTAPGVLISMIPDFEKLWFSSPTIVIDCLPHSGDYSTRSLPVLDF